MISPQVLLSQDSVFYKNEYINKVDKNFQKQGLWKLYNPTSANVLICEYKDNELVGDILVYDKEDKLLVRMVKTKEGIKKFIGYFNGKTLEGYFKQKGKKTIPISLDGKKIVEEERDWIESNTSFPPLVYDGYESIGKFIKENSNISNLGGKHGRVIIEYVLNTNGIISKPKISVGSYKELETEALRIVKKMPRQQPGYQRGEFVKVTYKLPIVF